VQSRSLIVLPDDSMEPLLEMINGAKQSLQIKMFALSEERILRALIRAHGRGVKIRVMLNPARRSGEIQNTGSRSVLHNAGIDVLDSNPAFEVTHEKSMVCDDCAAVIGSANWEPENFEKTRDYCIVTRDAAEVREIVECFEADWSRRPFAPPTTSSLIWSPGTGRPRVADFIDGARHSLYVQNERDGAAFALSARRETGGGRRRPEDLEGRQNRSPQDPPSAPTRQDAAGGPVARYCRIDQPGARKFR
jgi:cardiolipin synthase